MCAGATVAVVFPNRHLPSPLNLSESLSNPGNINNSTVPSQTVTVVQNEIQRTACLAPRES